MTTTAARLVSSLGMNSSRNIVGLIGALAVSLVIGAFAVQADGHKKKSQSPFPPAGDPSAYTGPSIADVPDGLPHANEGAFEGAGVLGKDALTEKKFSIGS